MITKLRDWAFQRAVYSTNAFIRSAVERLLNTRVERAVDIAMFILIYIVYAIASWIDKSLSMFQLIFFIPMTVGLTLWVHKRITDASEDDNDAAQD